MSYYLAASLDTLRTQIHSRFPALIKGSIGWIGDAAHRARASQHNPDRDGSVDAIDVPHRPDIGLDVHTLVAQLVASADPRLQRIIWYRRTWTPARGWQAYTGSNGHTAHAHIETTDAGQDDRTPWRIPMFGHTTPPPSLDEGEEDMKTRIVKTSDGQHWRVNGPFRVAITPESTWKLAVLGKLELEPFDVDQTAFFFDVTRAV